MLFGACRCVVPLCCLFFLFGRCVMIAVRRALAAVCCLVFAVVWWCLVFVYVRRLQSAV